MSTKKYYKIIVYYLFRITLLGGLLFLFLPVLVIIPIAFSDNSYFKIHGFTFKWILEVMGDPTWISAFQTSLTVALITSLIAICLCIPAGEYLRKKNNKVKNIFYRLSILPILTPIVILASGLQIWISKIGLSHNLFSLILCNTAISLPIAFLIISYGIIKFYRINTNIEFAARLFGANSFTVFIKITLPNIVNSIYYAFALVFATVFNETVLAQFLCNTETVVISKKIFEGIRYEINPLVPAVSFLIILITFFFIILFFSLRSLINRAQ
jgi:putative spermidine/putrescine transport system permease protein